jgi:hypothetical protein
MLLDLDSEIIDYSMRGPVGRKDTNAMTTIMTTGGTMPNIPPWGSVASGKRKETEPVARFQVLRNANATEIKFDPPMYFPFITYIVPDGISL